jgi:hypothetical protein
MEAATFICIKSVVLRFSSYRSIGSPCIMPWTEELPTSTNRCLTISLPALPSVVVSRFVLFPSKALKTERTPSPNKTPDLITGSCCVWTDTHVAHGCREKVRFKVDSQNRATERVKSCLPHSLNASIRRSSGRVWRDGSSTSSSIKSPSRSANMHRFDSNRLHNFLALAYGRRLQVCATVPGRRYMTFATLRDGSTNRGDHINSYSIGCVSPHLYPSYTARLRDPDRRSTTSSEKGGITALANHPCPICFSL